jgi:hypothetical protein
MYTQKDLELAWIAGFMDGEGTITIKKYARYKGQSIRYQAYMCICQATEDNESALKALELVQKNFGGSIYPQSKSKDTNARSSHQWLVVSSTAVDCVKQLLPYLVVKRKQAELLIKYGEGINSKRGAKRLTDEILQQRYDYWYEMRKLNVRGTNHLQRLNEETAIADVIV